MLKPLGLIACLLLFPLVPAHAAQYPWYVGTSLGTASYGSYYNTPYDLSYRSFETPSVPTVSSVSKTNTATGYDVFGGFSFNPYVTVEAHYLDMGTIHAYVSFAPPFQPSSAESYSKFTAIAVDAIVRYPFGNSWNIFGRAGLIKSRFETQDISIGPCAIMGAIFNCTGISEPVYSSNRNTYDIGGGISFAATDHWILRAGYTHYHHVAESGLQPNDGSTPSVDFLYLGVIYRI